MRHRTYDILLVEPKSDSVSRFTDSFETSETPNNVTVVSTGDQALDYIDQHGDYTDAPRPDLVLLDYHLPETSGIELLIELKDRPELQHIPVLVLTSSDATEEISRSYALHANACLQKPDSADEFDQMVQAIEDFWLNSVHFLPKEK
ncbi:response regulator [Natrinema hispanicum]|uniref:Response regulator receiver domain-containing protein n=1 Tax=Natrinema hispanicum TaxID=392421 RepID=A0A1G6YHF8_9EURY|nr:response regulator [Natrinema hispanicum]SDD88986.1 Response regulator receiver domain-containing protein [Natrinema hispanicum]SEU15625.1 Response regulator receiver domain-containing protein [Natrinema hispanicum]